MSTPTKGRPVSRKFTTATLDDHGHVWLSTNLVAKYVQLSTGQSEYDELTDVRGATKSELVAFCLRNFGSDVHYNSLDRDALVALIDGKVRGAKPAPAPAPVADVSPETSPVPAPVDGDDALAVLRKLLGGGGIDPAQLEAIVTAKVAEHVARPVVVKIGDAPEVNISGLVHKVFPDILARLRAGVDLFLTGGPGVGKTTVADQCGEALGVPTVVLQADPMPQGPAITGYHSPVDGRAINGAFRHIYEHGGIGVIDEFDTGHPSLGPRLNLLLAQDFYDFPTDGGGVVRVRKHPNFRVIVTGNTFGTGGSLEFSGTARINAATLDRFTFVHVGIDDTLEARICESISLEASAKVLPVVRRARQNIDQYALKVFVTPRASIQATKLVASGLTLKDALAGRLTGRGLPADQEAKVLEGISL